MGRKINRSKLFRLHPNNSARLIAALLVAAVGTYLVVNSKAATFVANSESESGSVAGNASIVSDSIASGGQAVTFGGAGQSLTKIRAAVYYPWFPDAWNQQGYNPFTNYTPTLGSYSSTDTATINTHIDDLIYAGMNSAIYSWWGQGSIEDTRFQSFLNATGSKPLKWALYYECEGNGSGGTCGSIGGPNPSVANITSDLTYIKSHYASNPDYLHFNGKPVIFVYGDGTDSCATPTRWKTANATEGFYVVLKVFSGYASCADQPDNWHQYGPAVAEDVQNGHSISISPGYWKKGCPYGGGVCTQGDTQPFLARDLTRWTTNVTDLKNSTAPIQLVTTYNEWGEGSSIESANGTLPNGWQSSSGHGQFVDILHQILVNGTTPDNPPTISLTAPSAGTVSGNVTLTATASDDHGVSKIEFLADGAVVNTSGANPASPYSYTWNSASVANGTHTITARATDTAGQQTPSPAVTVTVANDSTPPTVPTGLSATAISATQVNLSWTASTDSGGSGLKSYEISRGGTVIASVNAPTTTYSDTTVAASTTYSYTIKAIDGAGNKSAASSASSVTTPTASDTTPPTVPGNFKATLPVPTNKTVHLSWTASTDNGSGVKNYILSRNGTVIATPAANAVSYDDSTTIYATNYTYTIAAVDNAGNTSAAATSSITTPAAPPDTQAPDVPTANASVVSTTQVTISWNAVSDNPKDGTASGVKGYRVFRDGTQIADILSPSTSTNDGPFNFVSGQTYKYTVLAYDVAGNASAQSAQSSVIPNPVVSSGNVCTNAATGNKIDTVIVIAEENRHWSDVGGVGFGATDMPYAHSIASQCGVFQQDTEVNISDNSAQQYVGAWTGFDSSATHVSNDCSPSSSCSYTGNNLFRALRNAGIPHREYVEGATTSCSSSGNVPRHIPDLYMWDATDKAACPSEVLPMSQFSFSNPPSGFTFITPTLCNDGHDCNDSTVDGWLKDPSRLPALFNTTAYKSGKVLVDVWWDEDHPRPNLFACWSCKQFNSATDPHYSGESLLWLNLLGAPNTNLGAISNATDIRSTIGTP